jgi:hypothetical protein
VNDPRLGWVEGAPFEIFVAASHAGLVERMAEVEHVATTITPQGAVEECIVTLVRHGVSIRLPVAIAAVLSADILDSVRVYHSMQPLLGMHLIRPPILSALAQPPLPDVVGRYHQHLSRGEISGVLRQFEADGLVREPEGEFQVHRGAPELGRFFDRLLSHGGIAIESCAITDDGTCCALEYNVTAWGQALVPHQAGIAVYRRAPTGLLAAARMYHDIEPPGAVIEDRRAEPQRA